MIISVEVGPPILVLTSTKGPEKGPLVEVGSPISQELREGSRVSVLGFFR